jgi:hypothetical protein
MRFRWPGLLLVVVAAVVVAGDRVAACSCGPVAACDRVGSGARPPDALFVGEVLSMTRLDDGRQRASFRVSEPLLGVAGDRLDVFTGPNDGFSCAYYPFVPGGRFLVFASRTAAGELQTGTCTGTERIDRVDERDLSYLRGRLQQPGELGTIEGRVAQDPWPLRGTRPLSGVRVVVAGGGLQQEALTGADGFYRIPVPVGVYTVTADVPAPLYTSPRLVELADPRGCSEANVYARFDGRISGRLLDARGQPIADMPVDALAAAQLSSSFVWPASQAISNAAGEYEIRQLPAGEYLLGIATRRLPQGSSILAPGTSQASAARRIPVADGERVRAAAFALPPGVALVTVSGVVRDASGQPRPGVAVGVFQDDEPSQTASVMTNEQGEFRITLLPSRRYRLRASYLAAPRRMHSSDLVAVDALTTPAPVTLLLLER